MANFHGKVHETEGRVLGDKSHGIASSLLNNSCQFRLMLMTEYNFDIGQNWKITERCNSEFRRVYICYVTDEAQCKVMRLEQRPYTFCNYCPFRKQF
jgi:hypothetical protein